MQIVGKLPVIAGWRDPPLALEDLAEGTFIIKTKCPLLVSNTSFMTTRKSQIVLLGDLNTDLWIDGPQF